MYSSVNDLLLADLPVADTVDKETYVRDAADEIDAAIGFRYETPVNMDDSGPVTRPARLLLKRISNFLATGRLIHALAGGGEDSETHAYANRLIREALGGLNAIANGNTVLEGAPVIAGTEAAGPRIINGDAASAVDAFYNRVMVPETGLTHRDWAPGANPTGTLP